MKLIISLFVLALSNVSAHAGPQDLEGHVSLVVDAYTKDVSVLRISLNKDPRGLYSTYTGDAIVILPKHLARDSNDFWLVGYTNRIRISSRQLAEVADLELVEDLSRAFRTNMPLVGVFEYTDNSVPLNWNPDRPF